jgi:hypothetical protein
LINGTYYGTEQTEAEVREQMGDELFNLAYPNGYNAAVNGTTSGAGGTSGGSYGGTGGTSGGSGSTGATAESSQGLIPGYQPKADSQQPVSLSPLGYLPASYLSTGKYEQPNTVDYAQIIPKLAMF